jgi:Na+-translocating ferredoxin:NAD+ oxidoreductase RnfD subunit
MAILGVTGHRLPIVLPSRHDPRLKLSAVITSLQVLGQVSLGFKLSISQILTSIAVCAAIEMAVTLRRDHVLAWPASAILTGNSVAFILRANGTAHGDWWTFHGVQYFVFAAVLSMLSKYVLRTPGHRHVFNPSNIGIVLTLLLVGPDFVFPQYLWWGPSRGGVALAFVVIGLGALWILPKVGMVSMAASFLVTLAALIGALAVSGRSFVAVWQEAPVAGMSYWLNLALSPEVLIFVFFMMSDPQTAPRPPIGRVIYGVATAAFAALLLSSQQTEFGVKLAILSSLTVVCALVPVIEQITARPRPRLAAPAMVAATVIAVFAMAATASMANDKNLVLLERGLPRAGGNPQ